MGQMTAAFLVTIAVLVGATTTGNAGKPLPTDEVRGSGIRVQLAPNAATIQRKIGGEVSVMCTASGAQEDNYGLMWTKHNGIDKTGNVVVKKLDARNIVMEITNATVADSGFYQCTASADGQYVEKSVDIFFLNELRFVEMNNHLDQIPSRTSVNISCRVNKVEGEKLRTTWTKYGEPIPADGNKYGFHEGGAIFQIKEFDLLSDPGEYVCKVDNLTTGNKIKQIISVGGHQNARRATCVNHCSKFCTNMFPVFV
ncbi:zig-6 [Pristionchus pacificus]|uniref:Zig-6 n=1 Tax=Pristionchus pacificus TaxID=54126 RepID=A0A2A6CU90_PRIPA|nr:zig-6 [Pristionchus pacificus]|eukprot:PDM81719.1 zig-6 [Pristionchus pacificus]